MSNNSSTASRVAAHNSKGVPYTGWIEGVGYLAANPSIDWAVARKKGALIYPGELLEIPPVFEEANAQNRPVPRAETVDLKSFYGEKVDASSGADVIGIGRVWKQHMPITVGSRGGLLVVSKSSGRYVDIRSEALKSEFFRTIYRETPIASRDYRFHPVNSELNQSTKVLSWWSWFVASFPFISGNGINEANVIINERSISNYHRHNSRLLIYYRDAGIVE